MTVEEFDQLCEKREGVKYLSMLVNYLSGVDTHHTTMELMVGVDMIKDQILPIAQDMLEEIKQEFECYQKVKGPNR